jgi:DNA repair photolyase
MKITEIQAKSILRGHKKVDSWFLSSYGMNLYRGCSHNCVYCDGRAEKYNVEGEFGQDVSVKINAIDILRRELDPKRKRTPFKSGYMALGGGVGDSYQPIDQTYQLSRQALQLLIEFNHPVHILTKSTLIERDMDLIKQLKNQTHALVCFSFSSIDDKLSAIFEPGVPSPSKRLETISKFKKEGIACGIYLMPVIPFITDSPFQIEQVLIAAKQHDIDFVIFSGMTLKEGRQKAYFLEILKKHRPELITEYEHIYPANPYGQARAEYYQSIQQTFSLLAQNYQIPQRIPAALFQDLLSENDLVIVLLEHIDYYLKSSGRTSPYGYAAYSLSQVKQSLSSMKTVLRKLKGIGPKVESVILEILSTGRSSLYEMLVSPSNTDSRF